MAGCACADDFRIETTDLRSGQVKAVLHPTQVNWETLLNDFGQGSMTVATKDVLARQIWPRQTGIYVSRIAGGNASPQNPICEFAGIIEKFNAGGTGTVQVGMNSIESYLNHRGLLTSYGDDGETDFEQCQLCATLVQFSYKNGIPLTAQAVPGSTTRNVNYNPWDRKILGEAIQQITQFDNGPDWSLSHSRSKQGQWSTVMTFQDDVGSVRNLILKSNREALDYGLDVDGKDLATYVDAIGTGAEEDMLIENATDTSGTYPQYDAFPPFKDTDDETTLASQAAGYLKNYQDPLAMPSVTIRGFDVDPALTQLGDTLTLDVDNGATTYKGQARIIGRSWSLAEGQAHSRTFSFTPIGRSSATVLYQQPTTGCTNC